MRAVPAVDTVPDDIVREFGVFREARTVHIRRDDILLEVALIAAFRAVAVAAEHLSEGSFHVLRLTAVVLESDDVHGRASEGGTYDDIADTAFFAA